MQEWITEILSEDVPLSRQVTLIRQLSRLADRPEVLVALVKQLLSYSDCLAHVPEHTMDIVGTGGDGFHTLNFSTLSAIVVAAAGVPVAKHGNRSISSRCGSFDLLEALKVVLPQSAHAAEALLKQHGVVFLFNVYFHPVIQRLLAARKVLSETKEKTFFNLIGPMMNPARVKRMVMGVYDPHFLPACAEALSDLGVEYGYVVHGAGLDEVSLTGVTHYQKIKAGVVTRGEWTAEDFGLPACKVEDLVGGDPQENLEQSKALLNNELTGPKRDMVLANAAAALHVAQAFGGDLLTCVQQADEIIHSGKALALLTSLQQGEH